MSISYLRCLIEHVRCYVLDRDIELIYYTIRKSSDVLTRDPMQLGSQLISWLRPISEHDDDDNSLLSMTVRSATAWCDGYAVPLLVPLTGWLPAPLPSQIRTMTVSGTGCIRAVWLAPSKQHLILATSSGDVQQWHIMSNSLDHIFKGEWRAFVFLPLDELIAQRGLLSRTQCGSHVPPGGSPVGFGAAADRLRGCHCSCVARRAARATGAHKVSTLREEKSVTSVRKKRFYFFKFSAYK